MRTLVLTYPTPMAEDEVLEGKFLQLRLDARDYILCAAATKCRYHNQLQARFLSEQGIPHRWEGEEKLIVDHYELTIIGGGRFRLDVTRESLYELTMETLDVFTARDLYNRSGELLKDAGGPGFVDNQAWNACHSGPSL